MKLVAILIVLIMVGLVVFTGFKRKSRALDEDRCGFGTED